MSLAVILAIGFSRIYLGVHYVSDVWAGYLIGLLILITTVSWFERNQWKNGPYERVAISRKSKIAIVALISFNAIFYLGLAFQHYPPFAEPTVVLTQLVKGDIDAYFNAHAIPRYTETLVGNPQEPLGFIFLAKDDYALVNGFEQASWYAADKAGIASVGTIARAALFKQQYVTAPMTPSFWNAAVNDFGFEKPTEANTITERHHIRIWKTNMQQNGLTLYVGTASLDVGIKWLITHRISPDIDTERVFVMDSLQSAGVIARVQEIQFVNPTLGKNFNNDAFFTNGKLFIVTFN